MVTEYLKSVYEGLKEVVSPDLNYHRYKQEICSLDQVPCVPKLSESRLNYYTEGHKINVLYPLGFVLSELEAIDSEHPQFYQDKKDLVNFQRRKKLSKVLLHIQRYQGIPYNLHPIEVTMTTGDTTGVCVLKNATIILLGGAAVFRKFEKNSF